MRPFKFLRAIPPEGYPQYYETEEFECVGVTPILYDPITFDCHKYILFKHRETGETIKGNKIERDHPLWNYDEGL